MGLDERLELLQSWLINDLRLPIDAVEIASQDASFRRYFRVSSRGKVDQPATLDSTLHKTFHDTSGHQAKTYNADSGQFKAYQPKTYIVMDAPPEKESITEFIRIANQLSQQGVHTPKLFAHDISQGFILMEDLGNRTLLNELENNELENNEPKNKAEQLYKTALRALEKIQGGYHKNKDFALPLYDRNALQTELDVFVDWYLKQHLSLSFSNQQQKIWRELCEFLINVCCEQPQVWVHRDYHSRNLMITLDNSPGVIDFQDMIIGPVTYDLASLFKDCYIEWPRHRQLTWVKQYYQQLNSTIRHEFSLDELYRWFDLTGLQRHLKVLGVFSRLHYRDGKSHYLNDLPLVEKYIFEVLKLYPDLNDFRLLFASIQTTQHAQFN